MTRARFQQGLDELNGRLLTMAGLAERAVDEAITAYQKRDADLCRRVLENESTINEIEREIDELAFDLLAMQQPMAGDLRFVLAVTRINSDLERVGDLAVNIAQRVLDLVDLPPADLPPEIGTMAATASGMIKKAIEAFVRRDSRLAQGVLELDDIVDGLNRRVFSNSAEMIRKNPSNTGQTLDALLVARNVERVADHATNIAEDVIFWVSGADVRHSSHS
jgi:phosphate transport system protein